MMALKNKQYSYDLTALLEGFVPNFSMSSVTVTGLSLDSRTVQAGDIFFALNGMRVNGAKFVRDAIKQGAVAVLMEDCVDELTLKEAAQSNVPIIYVPVLAEVMGDIAARFYSAPSQQLKLIGVTGTDGKTSVTHFIAQALNNLNKGCGVIGTLGNGLYGALSTATHTTPDILRINKILSELHGQAEVASMEVSSHGIDQKRIKGLCFETVVLTNLSRDHLDYHGSLAAYKAVKRQLFVVPGLRNVVVNVDDEFGRELLASVESGVKVWSYGFDQRIMLRDACCLLSRNLQLRADGFSFEIVTAERKGVVNTSLLGQFNASNLLAAAAALLSIGIDFDDVLCAFQGLKGVNGRVELHRLNHKANVVIDYAHTPLALKTVLSVLKAHYSGSLFCVFGCGGDRDKGKRALMAEVAAEYSDYVVLTDDNPRNEAPEAIMADIVSGLKGFKKYRIEHDRKKAISYAIAQAGKNDVVLVAGKGHEDYQIIGQQRHSFSDRQVVLELLQHEREQG